MEAFITKIRQFIRELRRRRVLRVAAVYAGVGFVILQLGEILVGPFNLPGWTLRMITLILVLGFPLTMVLTWVYDITEEGIVRTPPEKMASGDQEILSGVPTASRAMTVGLLFAAVGLLLYFWIFAPEAQFVDDVWPVSNDPPPPLEKTERQTKKPPDRSIAVLPFDSLGEVKPGFTRGIHDALLGRLANVSGLKVIARTSVEQYRGTEKTVSRIGQELGVKWVLEGAIQQMGNQIQVNAQLIDARNDMHTWAKSYRRDLTAEDLFGIQNKLVNKIASSLEAELSPQDRRQVDRRPTEDLKAFRLYIDGRHHLENRTEREIRLGMRLFRQAIGRDSTYALAWSGLADAQTLLVSYGFASADTILSRALTAARRAKTIAPDLSEARASLGLVHLALQKDGPAAAQALEGAIDRDPNYVRAHHWLGLLQMVLGEPQAGLDHLEQAAALDPLSPSVHVVRGASYGALDSTTKSVAAARRAVSLSPEYPSALMVKGYALTKVGRPKEALPPLNRGLGVERAGSDMWQAFRGWPAVAHVRAGDATKARAFLTKLDKEEETRFARGLVHAVLRNVDAAFRELARAKWTYMSSILIRYDSVFSPLRDDPRYQRVIHEVNKAWGLPPGGRVSKSQPPHGNRFSK